MALEGSAPAAAGAATQTNTGSNTAPDGGGSPQGKPPGSPSASPGGLKEVPPVKSSPGANPDAAAEHFDVKVNGKIVRMTRQEALDHASMSYAANDRFNEAKKIKGEVDKIITRAKENPIEALMDPALGLSKDQIRDAIEKWYHKEFIEPETLNEDQKKVRDYEAKLKKYEDEEKTKKQQAEQDEETKLTNTQRERLTNQIIETLETSDLPKEKFFASRIAFYMRQAHMNGWEAPKEMIVKQVKNECTSVITSIAKGASGEQLVKIFGDEIVNKIRQHDLKMLREKRQLPPASVANNRAGTGPVNTEKMYSSDVAKRLRDMRSGKI